jgi:hypothetical protein
MERARIQEELENRDDASTMSVKHARELAAKMNAQLDAGVAAAEERNELADKQLEQIKRDREDKENAKHDKFSLLQSMIHKKQSLTQLPIKPEINSAFFHPMFAKKHLKM